MGQALHAILRAVLSVFWALVWLFSVGLLIGVGTREESPGVVFLILGLAVAIYGGVAAHELGHLLVALAVRFRPRLVQIGPLRVIREAVGWRLRLDLPSLLQVRGLVNALPDAGGCLRGRMALFCAGGPLASLLVGASCLGLFLATYPSSYLSPGTSEVPSLLRQLAHRPLTYGLFLGAIWNLSMVVGSLVPARPRKLWSDGARLLFLFWDGARAERDLELTLLTSAMIRGLRPRDWSPARVQHLLASCDGSPSDAGINLYAYYHAIDCGDEGAAGEFLDLAARQGDSPAVLVEVAYFEGFHRRNSKAARAALRRVRMTDVELHTYLRARAAVCLAEGSPALARSDAAAALEVSQRSADLGGTAAERDLLRRMLDECTRPDSPEKEMPSAETSTQAASQRDNA